MNNSDEATASRILRAVSEVSGIDVLELVGRSRRTGVVAARNLAIHAMREAGFTLKMIGDVVNRDHSTVIHSLRDTTEQPNAAGIRDSASTKDPSPLPAQRAGSLRYHCPTCGRPLKPRE